MLVLILTSLLFIAGFNIFQKSLESPMNFKVKVIDKDGTKFSKTVLNRIKKLDGVKISANFADVEYVIKKGFQERFSRGKFESLIEVRRKNFKSGIKVLNDRIVTGIISDYIYQNLYNKIRTVEKITFDEYKKNLSETELENDILSISINGGSINKKFNPEVNYSDYAALFYLLVVALNFGISQFTKLKRFRNMGIINRLRISGIREGFIASSEISSAVIKFSCVLLMFMVMSKIDFKNYAVTGVLFCVNLIIDCLLEKILKSEEALIVASRGSMVLLAISGMLAKFYL